MKLLSIDQSLTNCACILWEDGNMIDHFVVQTPKDMDTHIRIYTIVNAISYYLEDNNVDKVVLEGLSFGSISTSVRMLAGLYYSILIATHVHDIEWEEVTPKSVKKFACHGKASKKEMWEALPDKVKAKFEATNKTIASGKYDLADAYFIGAFCLKNLGEI